MLAIWFWVFVAYFAVLIWALETNKNFKKKIAERKAAGLSVTKPLIFMRVVLAINCLFWPITIWFTLYEVIKRLIQRRPIFG